MRVLFCLLLIAGAAVSANATNDVAVAADPKLVAAEEKAAAAQQRAVEAEERAAAAEAIVKEMEEADPWEGFAPPPDSKFDWVQMSSGEWLKGEIKVMYSYMLEFDSDELGLLDLDMDDIKQIRSAGNQEILIEAHRRNTQIVFGKLVIDGEQVKMVDGDDVQEFKRHNLVSIARGHNRERDNWAGSFSVGATIRGGNTETMDINTSANLKRRTAMTRLNIDYLATYSEAKSTDPATGNTFNEETANSQRLDGYFDWFLTSRFYWQVVAAEHYADPFVNIYGQYSVSSGAGYDLLRSSRTEWTVNAGVGYQETKFDSVTPPAPESSDSPFGTVGTRLDCEISGDLDFLYDYNARFLSEDNGAYTHHMVATLSYEIISDFDIDLSIIWDRIENPQPDDAGLIPEQDDYQLVAGIGYSF